MIGIYFSGTGNTRYCVRRLLRALDGAGLLARLLERHGAVISGGLHVKMPDSVCDERALKRPLAQNQALVLKAAAKLDAAAPALKDGQPPREGLSLPRRLAGLFGQRLYFGHRTNRYSDRLKIDGNACTKCGKCVKICPMRNLSLGERQALPGGRCTMCYRCVSLCPARAITLLGTRVYEQCRIENYL